MSTWQRTSVALPLAVLGAVLGLASLLGEWARVVLYDGTTAPAVTAFSQGLCGFPYTLALIAMFTMVAVALFGRPRGGSSVLRVAGLVLAALSLAILGAIAYFLRDVPYRVEGYSFDSSLILGWGIYAAFGAWAALGVALLLYSPPRRPPETFAEEAGVE